ncbi:2-methyl-6-phytyl-1,4-hydroquinone methyltransferase, chloroplastic-like [Gossypium australe]|uniref:2-methyl-6-phytyl-1,4-hydroquinone methyltransferase, chloroplastic-like n=1 Tax=Gossypium australe TaxID=47621 RepID=A0A5B6WXK2_9ROSI|nr:2-methyl-6-phytyl-1,4-hydroquinone methyltransferase, chloroplastic-like [Gossypium australe]
MCIPASMSRTTRAVVESKIRLMIALRFPFVKVAFHIVGEVQTEGIRSHCRFRHLWKEVKKEKKENDKKKGQTSVVYYQQISV